MENRINELLKEIKLVHINGTLEETCAIVQIEDINDIMLFNVGEININNLTVNFNNWILFDENMQDDQYITTFPQAIIKNIAPAVYEITFEFYGYDEILHRVNYNLCTASVRHILNKLLTHKLTLLLKKIYFDIFKTNDNQLLKGSAKFQKLC